MYRNYYAIEDVIKYINTITEGKYTESSIRKAICNTAEKYGIINWFKFLRIIMSDQGITNKEVDKSKVDKIALVNKIKSIFGNYLKKKKVWKGV